MAARTFRHAAVSCLAGSIPAQSGQQEVADLCNKFTVFSVAEHTGIAVIPIGIDLIPIGIDSK